MLGALPLAAQDATPPKVNSDYVVPFSTFYGLVGRLNADPTMLNSHFARPDLPNGTGFDALSNDAYAVGFGGYFPFSRLLLGFEWYYADFGYETSPQGKTNDAQTVYAMAMIGYPIFTTWRLTVFPYAGVGAGQMRITLKNRDGGATVSLAQSPTFDEIILSPGSDSQILGKYLIVQPGIGLDYLILKDDTRSHLGVTLGIRFGTVITPNRTPWTYRGKEVFGGPTFQPSGNTLRVLIGIGGFKMARP
jgi:opacity protein-like surface antigen